MRLRSRLPSLERLASSALATLRRFPAVVAAAALGAAAGLAGLEGLGDETWIRLLVVSTLALPLTFAISATAERRAWSPGIRGLGLGLAVAALAAVFLAWPGWTEPVRVRRYLQLSFGFHLAAAFLPFLGVDEPRGFWQYNRALLLRFLTAAFYVVVLQAGLSLAVGALDQLFGVPVPDETYLRLWIVLGLLFQTWFFLAGVPDDLAALEAMDDYPRGLKLFVQYVLVPLVVVYLLILTAYAVKVVATWDWPSGWIGWLVSVVAVVGILAYLLVHPVRRATENRWVRIYGRWFWVALLPSVVLLGLAVWQRVAQYGVTEDRYFLAVGTLWLGGTALYHVLTGSEEIERVPQTLCVVVLAAFVGPWSAYAVAESSQLGRLRGLLTANEMLVDGRARAAPADVSFEDRKEISAAVRYLVERHGGRSLAPLFPDSLLAADSVDVALAPRGPGGAGRPDTVRRREARPVEERVVASLGIAYVHPWEGARAPSHVSYHAADELRARPLGGYGHLVGGVHSGLRDTVTVDLPGADGGVGTVRLVADSSSLRILAGEGGVLELSVADLAARLRAQGLGARVPVPPEAMRIEGVGGGLRVALWLESVTARTSGSGDRPEVTYWRGELLVGAGGGAPDGTGPNAETEADVTP